jgi:aspartate aminotransferase
VAGYLDRRGVPTSAEKIMMAPGSKAALFAIVHSLPGDIVIPQPSWVSYAAHATLAGRRVIRAEIGHAGGIPDPVALTSVLDQAVRDRRQPGILILTVPDNPTGTVASAADIQRVLEIASERGLAVVSDEIYRDLAYEQQQLCTPGMCMPDQVIVTGGLSKALSLGGWRIGFARFPDTAFGHRTSARVLEIASEVWSCMSSPLEAAARCAFAESPELVEYVSRGRRMHRLVCEHIHGVFRGHGAVCRAPQAAFYLYPDLGPLIVGARGDRHGLDGARLARWLLDQHGVAVLPGAAFGDAPEALRFRVATSQLYGTSDDQRRETMQAVNPVVLPWIADSLRKLDVALESLTHHPG